MVSAGIRNYLFNELDAYGLTEIDFEKWVRATAPKDLTPFLLLRPQMKFILVM